MARVKNAQTANITYNTMAFTAEPPLRPIVNKRCHNTADSSGEKREKKKPDKWSSFIEANLKRLLKKMIYLTLRNQNFLRKIVK